MQLDHVEEGAVAAPAPADEDLSAAEFHGNDRLDGGEVRPGLLRAFDAEGIAHRDVVVGVGLDLFDQRAEPGFDARCDRRHGGWERGHARRAGGRRCAAATDEVFPRRPLLAGAEHGLLATDDVVEVIGVRLLRGHDGGGERQHPGVTADVGGEH